MLPLVDFPPRHAKILNRPLVRAFIPACYPKPIIRWVQTFAAFVKLLEANLSDNHHSEQRIVEVVSRFRLVILLGLGDEFLHRNSARLGAETPEIVATVSALVGAADRRIG